MIISKYITKEITLNFVVITFILLFIAMNHQFVGLLSKSAAGQIPINLALKVLCLYIPEFLGMLAPLSLFISTLFVHSRLHTDSEASALLTCGFGWASITRITMQPAIIISVCVGILTIGAIPDITKYRERILADGEASAIVSAITAGRFQSIEGGALVFYVKDIDKNNILKNIFIAQQPSHKRKKQSTAVITAEAAQIKQVLGSSNKYFLVLHNGYRYIGTPGTKEYSITHFDEYGRELTYMAQPVPDYTRLKPSKLLMLSNTASDQAELQWRLAMPIAVLILAVLAIPLAKVRPREGQYAKFLPAITLFIIYYNLMTLARRWIQDNTLSSTLGIWWVHIIFLGFSLFLLTRASGRLSEWKYHLLARRNKVAL